MANNCGPNCECKGGNPYQSVTLVLNAGEVDALRFLLDDCRLIWPDLALTPQARAIQQVYDRLSAAIADAHGRYAGEAMPRTAHDRLPGEFRD